jgi:hypothetical protein
VWEVCGAPRSKGVVRECVVVSLVTQVRPGLRDCIKVGVHMYMAAHGVQCSAGSGGGSQCCLAHGRWQVYAECVTTAPSVTARCDHHLPSVTAKCDHHAAISKGCRRHGSSSPGLVAHQGEGAHRRGAASVCPPCVQTVAPAVLCRGVCVAAVCCADASCKGVPTPCTAGAPCCRACVASRRVVGG